MGKPVTHTNLTEQIQSIPTFAIDLASCELCGSQVVGRLPMDWQERVNEGGALPILGCGNPWHYCGLEGINRE